MIEQLPLFELPDRWPEWPPCGFEDDDIGCIDRQCPEPECRARRPGDLNT